jgi:hypothetical protein
MERTLTMEHLRHVDYVGLRRVPYHLQPSCTPPKELTKESINNMRQLLALGVQAGM